MAISWRTIPADPIFGTPEQFTCVLGLVYCRFNPQGYDKRTGRIAFTIRNSLTYSGPMKDLVEATEYLGKVAARVSAAKTMPQLLKAIVQSS